MSTARTSALAFAASGQAPYGRGPTDVVLDRVRRGAADLTGVEVVENPPGTDPAPWEAAGATWCLTGFSSSPTIAEVEAAIDAL